MNFQEQAIVFGPGEQPDQTEQPGWQMVGILAVPQRPSAQGVVMVVGGPQYRAGSHRQFTLLSRHLAAQGVPVLRFDYGGMGDSDGPAKSFEQAGDDIRAAIDNFRSAVPAVEQVVLWGLCDAASAILFHAWQDRRVAGIVLLNPWVRTQAGIARATLKHYYARRLFDPSLWAKIARGRFDLAGSLRSLLQLAGAARRPKGDGADAGAGDDIASGDAGPVSSLPERMYQGLSRYKGAVLVICSGADLTAREFSDLAGSSKKWRQVMGRANVTRRDLPGADHTFSRAVWRDQVAEWTADWVVSIGRQGQR